MEWKLDFLRYFELREPSEIACLIEIREEQRLNCRRSSLRRRTKTFKLAEYETSSVTTRASEGRRRSLPAKSKSEAKPNETKKKRRRSEIEAIEATARSEGSSVIATSESVEVVDCEANLMFRCEIRSERSELMPYERIIDDTPVPMKIATLEGELDNYFEDSLTNGELTVGLKANMVRYFDHEERSEEEQVIRDRNNFASRKSRLKVSFKTERMETIEKSLLDENQDLVRRLADLQEKIEKQNGAVDWVSVFGDI